MSIYSLFHNFDPFVKYKVKNLLNSRRTRDISWNCQLHRTRCYVYLLLRNKHLARIQEEHLVEEICDSAANGKSVSSYSTCRVLSLLKEISVTTLTFDLLTREKSGNVTFYCNHRIQSSDGFGGCLAMSLLPFRQVSFSYNRLIINLY